MPRMLKLEVCPTSCTDNDGVAYCKSMIDKTRFFSNSPSLKVDTAMGVVMALSERRSAVTTTSSNASSASAGRSRCASAADGCGAVLWASAESANKMAGPKFRLKSAAIAEHAPNPVVVGFKVISPGGQLYQIFFA